MNGAPDESDELNVWATAYPFFIMIVVRNCKGRTLGIRDTMNGMSNLNFLEKRTLEKLLHMETGYVLLFSNITFAEFVADCVGIDPYSSKYDSLGSSKANRLRSIWKEEPNHLVGRLLSQLVEYEKQHVCYGDIEESLRDNARKIADRLLQSASVEDLESLTPNTADRDFDVLAKEVRAAIDKNTPETGLDRLHAFVVKYMRGLCETHGIATERDKPLHSLMGEYVKFLKKNQLIESEMTERILKSSISVLEAFNYVRNEQSLAHDNIALLNHSESLLIFNHVASAIKFITVLENRKDASRETENSEFGF
jgi:Abortive infection C-terminus